ncbi:MAG: hypothetical protein R8G34_04000 [Paracoccaceae bacterium]|nr:hypothetical protein [Paracoccaceae bacterium]
MTNSHWAIFALRDIQNSLDTTRYDVANQHIEDAIHAIVARDAQGGMSRRGSVEESTWSDPWRAR